MTVSSQYKRQVMKDLARGNPAFLEPVPATPEQKDQNLGNVAQQSSQDEHCRFSEKSLHPDHIPPSQMEPELQNAIAQIKPNERHGVAREFLKQLKERGLSDRDLENQLSLSTHHANRMNVGDVSRLATFTYHNHPDTFQDVLAEKPAIARFLSNPLVGAILGAIAAKWLGNRRPC